MKCTNLCRRFRRIWPRAGPEWKSIWRRSICRLSLANDWLVVEGAGGVLVPINQKQFMLDMMVKLKLPVILAARSALGTINHTLLTLAALHAAELPVHGVVLIGDQNRENRETIRALWPRAGDW